MIQLSLCTPLAYVRTREYEAEVREFRGGYLVVVRSPHMCRCIPAPKRLRSGRAGLDAAFELAEWMVEESRG